MSAEQILALLELKNSSGVDTIKLFSFNAALEVYKISQSQSVLELAKEFEKNFEV